MAKETYGHYTCDRCSAPQKVREDILFREKHTGLELHTTEPVRSFIDRKWTYWLCETCKKEFFEFVGLEA